VVERSSQDAFFLVRVRKGGIAIKRCGHGVRRGSPDVTVQGPAT
jgi:hypothetical protein